MRRLRAQLARLSAVPWPVRIEGPTGSGKGLAARLLHHWSARGVGPFTTCNINSIAEGLEIAELVGYVRGAFTGAVMEHTGAFEAAHGGTLFLDELGTASARVQRALLQLVEEGAVRRLGEQRSRRVDVRLVFATNTSLEEAVVSGRFRRDLYYRLGSLVIRMPSLAERPEDIPELAAAILEMKAKELGTGVPALGDEQVAALLSYDWPGNVRQLDRALEHFAVFGKLSEEVLHAPRTADWRERLGEALTRNDGNRSATARDLGISRKTLYQELKQRQA